MASRRDQKHPYSLRPTVQRREHRLKNRNARTFGSRAGGFGTSPGFSGSADSASSSGQNNFFETQSPDNSFSNSQYVVGGVGGAHDISVSSGVVCLSDDHPFTSTRRLSQTNQLSTDLQINSNERSISFIHNHTTCSTDYMIRHSFTNDKFEHSSTISYSDTNDTSLLKIEEVPQHLLPRPIQDENSNSLCAVPEVSGLSPLI